MSGNDLFSLKGRNALVTGGGQGLGEAMALGLAGHGANVAVLDIHAETAQRTACQIEPLGVKSLALGGDVTSDKDAKGAVKSVVDAWGTLDVLVNNAGISILEPAEDISLADVKRLYDIDVFGILAVSQAAFRPMARQKRGSIINIASMAGIIGVGAPTAAYNSAKAAVIMLTKTLAVEWAKHNIRVNAIAPGFMLSPRVRELQQEDPGEYSRWISRVPMRRAGEPVELQGLAVYLVSDASSYMTGSAVVIDGGYTCA
jgi:NAD(P)-dependent dehydrogenase (short-subunit alcohol dehydrogenase family)